MQYTEILKAKDLAHIWHPCTQMHDHESTYPLIPIKNAKGVYVYDFDDKAYIDCVSSWWVNIFGHCNPYINQKLIEQIHKLEHIILAGFSHEPIITLSSRLCEILPAPLNKCFFADNGSSAIEVALKMAYHAKAIESNTTFYDTFLSLQNAYHGETIGALSVGDVGLYKQVYDPILLQTLTSTAPTLHNTEQALKDLESMLDSHPNIVAFILEPLVQCAGNMAMHTSEFVAKATKMCQDRGIFVIFDEIAVGFGRSGSMFAFEQCGVIPDFLCLSKGLSGGYLPLSVVVTSDTIYEYFYAPYEKHKAFLHSHSYTGNPLACVCANAVLDIFDKENVIESNKLLSAYIWEQAQSFREFSFVQNMRQRGMILAFDLVGFEGQRKGIEIYNKALHKGLLLRPLGNTIYFMPPYIITKQEVAYVFGNLKEILASLR